MVSVVIPLYNKEATVARAIRSILAQTVQPTEIIVVNDGSTDKSADVVESFDDSRIKLIHQENAGVSAARNRGVEEATEELIAFLDADDEWLPSFLAKIQELMIKFPECGMYATRYFLENSKGYRIPATVKGLGESFEGIMDDYFEIAAKSDPPIWSGAVCISKGALDSIDGFPVGVKAGEDILTWARISAKHSIAYTMSLHSIFYYPESVANRSPRFDPHQDIVGNELTELLGSLSDTQIESFRKYLGFWYMMRLSIMYQYGIGLEAVPTAMKMIRFYGLGVKSSIFFLLALLPSFAQRRVYSFLFHIHKGRHA